jgi:hypothetical protein
MLKSKLLKLSATTGAAFTMGLTQAGEAFAAPTGGFNDVASKITDGISGLPGLLTAISYLMGLLFAVLGVLKIKDHVENPTQTQIKDGAIRLVVGGVLLSLPILTSAMQELVNTGDAAVDAQTLNKVQFKVN